LSGSGPTSADSAEAVFAVQWQVAQSSFDLALVNLAGKPASCRVHLEIESLDDRDWFFRDLLGNGNFSCAHPELSALQIDLRPHATHLFRATRGSDPNI